MRATQWEFRHRTWLFFAIFCGGLACYRVDPQSSGERMGGWLHAHFAFFFAPSQQDAVRAVFLAGALIAAVGATIRTWGGAYLRAEVLQDSKVRTERLVADGPFQYTRNPLYLGLLIGVIGAGVMCSPLGWVMQIGLAVVLVYRLIMREEGELRKTQSESFRDYSRGVPRLLPALKSRVPTSGAQPHWREAFIVQVAWWGIAAANVIWAITLRPSLAFATAGAGFVLLVVQKYVLKLYTHQVATVRGGHLN